jgi:hypothetical protein
VLGRLSSFHLWSCGRVARQSSAKASTAVRIRSGPPSEGTKSFAFFDMVRYSKWISLFAFVLLLVACFMPWTYHADVGQSFNGFYSEKNLYGKPAKLILVLAGITTLCSFIKVLWIKRTALLVGGLNVAYGIKNFLLFGSCYLGYCPEKKAGLFLMLLATILVFLMTFFPDGKVNSKASL